MEQAGTANVTVEVTINGQDFSHSGQRFRYYDPAAWRILSFAPRGGPLTGNTSIVVTSERLESLGDVRCRFGDHPLTLEMNGTIRDPTLVACVSPAHWERREGMQHVEVQLTLNGQDYLRFGPQARQFSYYALDDRIMGVAVLRLSPNGGPSVGGTLVRLTGSNLVDLGGVWCQFGLQQHVPATLIDQGNLICYSPASLPEVPFDGSAVEVTINGQLHALTSGRVAFHFYRPGDVRVSRIYPMGGPGAGGTLVTVFGYGFRDLNHGSGLHCDFGGTLVPATVKPHSSEQRLACVTPSFALSIAESFESCSAQAAPSVPVRLTLNGNNWANSSMAAMTEDDAPATRFTFHELQRPRVGQALAT
jgi:hypothetical protein